MAGWLPSCCSVDAAHLSLVPVSRAGPGRLRGTKWLRNSLWESQASLFVQMGTSTPMPLPFALASSDLKVRTHLYWRDVTCVCGGGGGRAGVRGRSKESSHLAALRPMGKHHRKSLWAHELISLQADIQAPLCECCWPIGGPCCPGESGKGLIKKFHVLPWLSKCHTGCLLLSLGAERSHWSSFVSSFSTSLDPKRGPPKG